MVMAHGSDADFAGNPLFRAHAAALGERGMASFLYDKRGYGTSGGDAGDDFDVLAADLLAAVRMLRARRDVDSSAVGVGGWSQAGWVIPLAATQARRGEIAFVALIGAAGTPPLEQQLYDRGQRLRTRGWPEGEVAGALAFRRAMLVFWRDQTESAREDAQRAMDEARRKDWFARLAADPDWPEAQQAPAIPTVREIRRFTVSAGRRFDILRHQLGHQPAESYLSLTMPLLAMWGSLDASSDAPNARRAIEEVVRTTGSRDATFRIFDGVNHTLRDPAAPPRDMRFPVGYLEYFADWVVARTSRRPGSRG
jgi:pimeloyl-ACP methyl ester carboxylesterase